MDKIARRIGEMQLPYPMYIVVSCMFLATAALSARLEMRRSGIAPGKRDC